MSAVDATAHESDEGVDSWDDIDERDLNRVSKRRDEIRRQIELGVRPDIVDEGLDAFWRSQDYMLVKWLRWVWEWCVGS